MTDLLDKETMVALDEILMTLIVDSVGSCEGDCEFGCFDACTGACNYNCSNSSES